MPDMTCEELRLYFEDHWRDEVVGADRGIIAEHIAACADCARVAEDQKELASSLRMVRESTGGTSQSLDAAVLRNYRQHVAQRQRSLIPAQRRWPRAGLNWAWAAVAALFLIGVVWLFSTRKPVTVTTAPPKVEPAETPS